MQILIAEAEKQYSETLYNEKGLARLPDRINRVHSYKSMYDDTKLFDVFVFSTRIITLIRAEKRPLCSYLALTFLQQSMAPSLHYIGRTK